MSKTGEVKRIIKDILEGINILAEDFKRGRISPEGYYYNLLFEENKLYGASMIIKIYGTREEYEYIRNALYRIRMLIIDIADVIDIIER